MITDTRLKITKFIEIKQRKIFRDDQKRGNFRIEKHFILIEKEVHVHFLDKHMVIIINMVIIIRPYLITSYSRIFIHLYSTIEN